MAETIWYVTQTTTQTHNHTEPRTTIKLTTVVRSTRPGRLKVNDVLDFAEALKTASAPDYTYIEVHRDSVGHPTQLVARWEVTKDKEDEAPAIQGD